MRLVFPGLKSLDNQMKFHTLRSAVLFLLILSLIFVGGHSLGQRDGFVLAGVLALSIIFLVYRYSDWRLKPLLSGEKLEGQDAWAVQDLVQKLSAQIRVPTPQVYLLPSQTPQALVFGTSLNNSRIYLTSSLLDLLNREELQCVLAQQLMSIRSRATLSFTLASAVSDAMLAVAHMMDTILAWILGSNRTKFHFIHHPISSLITPILRWISILAIGRRTYLNADLDAAHFMQAPEKMAGVLWKLHSYSLAEPFKLPISASPFCLVPPDPHQTYSRNLCVHPDINSRIVNLVGHFPI